MKISKKIFIILITTLLFASCNKDRQIKKVLNEIHEDEMIDAVKTFSYQSDSMSNFFIKKENGFIDYNSEFVESVNKITNLHKQYHNSKIIPRDSKEWETLTLYIKKPDGKKHPETICPYCSAEAKGYLEKDEVNWTDTYLYFLDIEKRKENLLELLKNDEMETLLLQLEKYLKTNKCFTDKKYENAIFKSEVGENIYSVIPTEQYLKIRKEIFDFHKNNCNYDMFNTSITDTLFYDEKTEKNFLCPICRLTQKKISENLITKENSSFPVYESDLYYWEKEGFATKIFLDYISTKEKEKLIASLPLYDSWTLDAKMRSGETKRKELDEKLVKVEGNIYSINNYSSDADEIEFTMMSGLPNIILPKSVTKDLNSGDYIIFIAKIKLTDDSYKYKFTDCEFVKKERNLYDSYFNYF